MSATTAKPLAGQHKSAAPFGAVAILAGVVALGAIGIAYGQSVRTAAPAGPDIQTIKDQDQSMPLARPTVDYPDQIPARVGTAASKVSDYPDQIPARVGTAASKVSDYPDQISARLGNAANLSAVASEALLANRYDDGGLLDLVSREALLADRYGDTANGAMNVNPGVLISGALGSGITGTGTGPQTGAQRGLISPDRWTLLQQDQFRQYQMSRNAAPVQPLRAHPARHPMAN